MNLLIDYKEKKAITQLVIKHTNHLRKMQVGASILKVLIVFIAIGYIGMNILLPNMNVVNVGGIPTKDYFNIVKNIFLIFALGLLFLMVLKLMLAKLASVNLNERVQEVMSIEGNILQYSFRTKFESDMETRIIIKIPLQVITLAIYDSAVRKLTFKGNILCYYVENYNEEKFKKTKPSKLEEFIIYDYFHPTLLSCLQENGLNIQRRNENECREIK